MLQGLEPLENRVLPVAGTGLPFLTPADMGAALIAPLAPPLAAAQAIHVACDVVVGQLDHHAAAPQPQSNTDMDSLWKVLDARAQRLDAAARADATDTIFAAGLTALASIGFIMWNTHYGYLLFSALAARPLWKDLDPVAVLRFWDRNRTLRRPCEPCSDPEAELRRLLD